MLIVLAEGAIHYIGEDRAKADVIFDSKVGATLCEAATLRELEKILETHKEAKENPNNESENDLSEAASRIFDKLKEMGFPSDDGAEIIDALRESGNKVVAEVRGLGNRGMDLLGDKFIALGELLRQAEQAEQEPQSTDTD